VIVKYEPTNSNEGMLDLNTLPVSNANAKTKMVSCWTCPLCPLIYKRRFNFDQHLTKVHQLQPEEVSSTWKSVLPQSEFALKQTLAKTQSQKKEPTEEGLSASSPKKDSTFGPKAFSSSFCCSFCGESFERDSNLLLHLQLQHSGEEEGKYRQALEDVKHYRMDGCSYQCAICQSKFSAANSFMRHAREMHKLKLSEYQEQHGSAEVETAVWQCRVCRRRMKHTRNILSQHMKTVHQFSFQEYRDQTQNRDPLELLPTPESPKVLFHCILCNLKIKGRKQHLNKVHHLEEEVYTLYQQNITSGAQIPELNTCKICRRICVDLPKHLKISHKLNIAEYDSLPESKRKPLIREIKQLRCYFGCKDVFKKESELLIHIDLVHANEDAAARATAKDAALSDGSERQRGTQYWCRICDAPYSGRSSFWGHITRKHSITLADYEKEFGKLGQSEQFQCKLCGKLLRHEGTSIGPHLKLQHGLTWNEYLALDPDQDLSQAFVSPPPVQCKLCQEEVKHLNQHLKHSHNMSRDTYNSWDSQSDEDEGETDWERDMKQEADTDKSIVKQESEWDRVDVKEEVFDRDYERCSDTSIRDNEDSLRVKNARKTSMLDVRDKTVKDCAVCDIHFPSRLLFLQHCQTLHNYKFKLKSGEILRALNTDPDENCDDDELEEEPERKKQKISNM